MVDLTPAIADLKASWHLLPDFERAQRVSAVIRAGLPRRQLAIALNTSDGTIRNLLSILEADPRDLSLFCQGSISRSELLRRVRGHNSSSESPTEQLEQTVPAPDPVADWLPVLPNLPIAA